MMNDRSICIGYYCGRLAANDSCGSCPNGWRSDNTSMCRQCDGIPELYDWLYLGFMAIIPFGLNITLTFRSYVIPISLSIVREWLLYILAFSEAAVAALCSILLFKPYGSISIHMCRVRSMSDWYTLFYNPTLDFVHIVHCTQEAVYPLSRRAFCHTESWYLIGCYLDCICSRRFRHKKRDCNTIDNLFSIVFVYYGLSIAATMIARPLIFKHCYRGFHRRLMYYALYIYPILIFIHFTCAGLIYYSFSYIILVGSLVLATYYYSKRFALDDVDTVSALLKQTFRKPRHLAVVLVSWTMHLYGVVAITQLRDARMWIPLLLIVPMPYFFYILSFPFTKPCNLYQY